MPAEEVVAKVILIICNTILTLFAVGKIIFRCMKVGKSYGWADSLALDIVIIVCAVVIIGLGWTGIYMKNRICLCIYAVVVLIFGVILFIIGIVTFTTAAGLEVLRPTIIKELEETYKKYPTSEEVKKEMDEMHTYFKCCGADKPILINNEYPKSCCDTLEGGKCLRPYEKPCIDDYIVISKVGITILGIISLIFGVFFVCAGIAAATYRHYIRLAQQ